MVLLSGRDLNFNLSRHSILRKAVPRRVKCPKVWLMRAGVFLLCIAINVEDVLGIAKGVL